MEQPEPIHQRQREVRTLAPGLRAVKAVNTPDGRLCAAIGTGDPRRPRRSPPGACSAVFAADELPNDDHSDPQGAQTAYDSITGAAASTLARW